MMAPSPTQTKAAWRKDGWFTEHEEKILVNRILRDDPSKGDMHNRQAITLKMLWKSLTDYHLWPIYLIGLTWSIPVGPPSQYLTLTLRGLGFDTFNSNLLTIPASVGQCLNVSALHRAGINEILTNSIDAVYHLVLRKSQPAIACGVHCSTLDPSMFDRDAITSSNRFEMGIICSCHHITFISIS